MKVIFGRFIRKSLSFQILYFILRNFVLFFCDFNGSSSKKEEWFYWNLRKKRWKMSVVVTICSNDVSARPPTLLKQSLPQIFSLAKLTNFTKAVWKNTRERLLLLKQEGCISRASHEICSPKHGMYRSSFTVSYISSS